MIPYSIYIHVPFCRQRCHYCDFNTCAGMEASIPAYVAALCREIESVASRAAELLPVHTVYFGGGTPSLLSPAQFASILAAVARGFRLQASPEISLEANPGTLTRDYLAALRGLGFDRLSLGVQSVHPRELEFLGRWHTYPDVIAAVKWARQAGFDNLSLDLIYGLPGQSLQSWQATLETCLGLSPEHLSLYALTIEPDTPLGRWLDRGLVEPPDPDLAADQYEWACQRLDEAGFTHYEISNWAAGRAGSLLACTHNLQYWRNHPYLGFGAGAHGYAAGYRTANLPGIEDYIAALSQDADDAFPFSSATIVRNEISPRDEMEETMMVGLRLTQEGVRRDVFQARFGRSLDMAYAKEIAELIEQGLLERGDSGIRLTKRGMLLGNQVFMRFIS